MYSVKTQEWLQMCYSKFGYNSLLLLLSSSSSSSSPLCRVPIHIFPRQTISLGDTFLQLFCLCCLWMPLSLVPALVLLFFYVSTFWSMCAVPNMTVFCSSLTSWFPGMSLTYFLNDLEMVPFAPVITGIILAFTFHMCCISIVRSLYLKIISAYFLITFLSPGIATTINIHIPSSLSGL
jgi:hypothetical protein